VQNFAFKFQAVAEKTAKKLGGYFILPHPVEGCNDENVNSRRPSIHKRLMTSLFWNGFFPR